MILKYVKEPKIGNRRTVTRFAFFPTKVCVGGPYAITQAIIWLQRYSLQQRYDIGYFCDTRYESWFNETRYIYKPGKCPQ